MDVVLLSRLQFAITVMFHYLFPPLTIGLGIMLVILEGMYLKTKNPQYEIATRFWTKIFALNFAMGVVTGIVMEFEFGTNWAAYSRFVGDVFGSALAAEGIAAVGAGRDSAEARAPRILDVTGVKVAFLACSTIIPLASVAGPDSPGIWPHARGVTDPDPLVQAVAAAKR